MADADLSVGVGPHAGVTSVVACGAVAGGAGGAAGGAGVGGAGVGVAVAGGAVAGVGAAVAGAGVAVVTEVVQMPQVSAARGDVIVGGAAGAVDVGGEVGAAAAAEAAVAAVAAVAVQVRQGRCLACQLSIGSSCQQIAAVAGSEQSVAGSAPFETQFDVIVHMNSCVHQHTLE